MSQRIRNLGYHAFRLENLWIRSLKRRIPKVPAVPPFPSNAMATDESVCLPERKSFNQATTDFLCTQMLKFRIPPAAASMAWAQPLGFLASGPASMQNQLRK